MARSPERPNHLDTGTWFLLLSIVTGLVGGVLSLCLHVPSLMAAGNGAFWHAAAMQHGPVMVAFSAIPALLGGFGTWFVPLQIGADDTAFPRMAVASLGLTAIGFVMTLGGLLPATPAAVLVAALYVTGGAILLVAANLIATMLNMRRPDMSLGAMPLFAWSQLIASCLALVTVPLLLAALTPLALHGAAAGEASARELSRFLGMPGYLIMILPAFGVISEIVSGLGRRMLTGRRVVIAAMAVLATVGYLDWANRLLSNDIATDSVLSQAAVILPALAILGCWALTLAGSHRLGQMLVRTPGLFALGFAVVLLLGGLTGLRTAQPMHYGLVLGTIFAMFAGYYWWIGKMTGKAYPEVLGRIQFWTLFAGVNLMELPSPAAVSLGAASTSLSVLIFAVVAIITQLRQRSVPADPWRLGTVAGPEWALPSPVRASVR